MTGNEAGVYVRDLWVTIEALEGLYYCITVGGCVKIAMELNGICLENLENSKNLPI